ncbi:MAG: hypothetical protein OEN56_02270 [Gemmatimonadota bacterium]|nr:hypothetical protein [Gemmatimonadota bacterium]
MMLILASAVWRLGHRGIVTIQAGLSPFEWFGLVAVTTAFVYGEGVRALGRRWVPDVIDRARRLRSDPSRLMRLSGPLYGLRLVGRDRVALFWGWFTTVAIVVAVFVVRALPEPWRGIVDFAVAGALMWALIVIVRRFPEAIR